MLKYASSDVRDDREVVMSAVSQDGWALEFASDELRADRDIVLAAVKHEGYPLKYASKELQGDREVLMAEIKQNLKALLSIHGSALKRMDCETKMIEARDCSG